MLLGPVPKYLTRKDQPHANFPRIIALRPPYLVELPITETVTILYLALALISHAVRSLTFEACLVWGLGKDSTSEFPLLQNTYGRLTGYLVVLVGFPIILKSGYLTRVQLIASIWAKKRSKLIVI